ncbi:MAG: hypothetical protein IJX93_10640 [Clostridia bacterium]|nr:hypothetical protein [Clostridia bacterium]
MKTIISVDAGGTKTRAVLLDEALTVHAETVKGCGNLAIDYPSAQNHILSAVSEILCASPHKPSAVIIGAAGVSAEGVSERLKTALENRFRLPVHVTSDGILALYSALGEQDGMTVVSGTGSILLAKKGTEIHRVGGWGHLLGEKGSAASIGYAMLVYICGCRDQGVPDEEAETAAYHELGVSSFGEMISFVYSRPKSDIARLASAENTLALSGNSGAGSRLRSAAAELSACTAELYHRLGFRDETISLSGGCIRHISVFREEFLRLLASDLPSAKLSDNDADPVCGGVAIWRQLNL